MEESAETYAPSGHRSINSLQHEVEEVQVVREAVVKVLTRGENLEELLIRADNLNAAVSFSSLLTYKVKTQFVKDQTHTSIEGLMNPCPW